MVIFMTELIGYAVIADRMLKIGISRDEFDKIKGYTSESGKRYVALFINESKLRELLNGNIGVVSVQRGV